MMKTGHILRQSVIVFFLFLVTLCLASCATTLDQQYYAIKDPDEALLYLDRRILFHPFFTDAHLERGYLHFRAHRYLEAISDFKKVASAKSDCVRCVVSMNTMMGSAYLELGDTESARKRFEKVRELAPDEANGSAGLGLVALKEGKPSAAVEAFSEAIRLDPKESSHYGNRGLA
jgi:Flp pilus assembly protein TadD